MKGSSAAATATAAAAATSTSRAHLRSRQLVLVQEIDVDVTRVVNPDAALLQQLAEWLAQLVVDCRATLRSLRLAGPLPLASIFEPMAPYAAEFKLLEVCSGCPAA